MKSRISIFVAVALGLLLTLPAHGQRGADSNQSDSHGQSGMNGKDMGEMHHDVEGEPLAAQLAHEAMTGKHMEMNPHMYMTDLRSPNPADEERAQAILDLLRHSIEKYKDYKAALADGFQIFLPNVPQPHYHFTSWHYAFEAQFVFNPAHPTSLLYKKVGDEYELEGAMFTAPRRDTEDDLNQRVPLSVALAQACKSLHAAQRRRPAASQLEGIRPRRFDFNS